MNEILQTIQEILVTLGSLIALIWTAYQQIKLKASQKQHEKSLAIHNNTRDAVNELAKEVHNTKVVEHKIIHTLEKTEEKTEETNDDHIVAGVHAPK